MAISKWPWTADTDKDLLGQERLYLIDGDGYFRFADDARLCALAPELLEFLRKAYNLESSDSTQEQRDEYAQLLDSLIRRTEGL